MFNPNYNPYYNPYYNRQFNGFNNPIRTPTNKNPIINTPKRSATKFTLSKFLSGSQEVIATISTAIPLYTQVKPLLSGAKNVTKSLTSSLFKKKETVAKHEVIDNPEIITPKKEKPKQEQFEEQTQPNRPFF